MPGHDGIVVRARTMPRSNFMITNALSAPGAGTDACRQLVRLDFDFRDSGIDSLVRLSRCSGRPERVALVHDGGTRYHLDLVLDGGAGDLFKFGTLTPFVGSPSADRRTRRRPG